MEIQSDDCTRNEDEDFRLHKLDDNCLLYIFSVLRFEDARNLGQTSKRLKNLFLFKYHKFTFEFRSDMLSKTTERGSKVLDVILLEYGGHIRSWTMEILNMHKNDAIEMVRRVSECSTNLKRLQLKGITNMDFLNCPEVIKCLPQVETLSFVYCQLIEPAAFLQYFRNLKQLHFEESSATGHNLQILFNQEIESYYHDGKVMLSGDTLRERTLNNDFVCEFGPKLNALCLKMHCDKMFSIGLDKMFRLARTNLTKLKLDLRVYLSDTFLIELAKQQPMLKELELRRVSLNAGGFKAVFESFPNLQTLILHPTDDFDFDVFPLSTTTWPKCLQIFSSDIPLGFTNVTSLIRTATRLKQLHLGRVDFQEERFLQMLRDSIIRNFRSGTLKILGGKKVIEVNYLPRRGPPLKFRDGGITDKIEIDFSFITEPQQKLTKRFAY